jgi:glutathionylspermidine synthase
VDLQERPINHIFKLYPWEMMVREPFGKHLPRARTRWIEAPWKMVLSNKAILTVLYELFPHSPYILPAAFEPTRDIGDIYIKKPMLGREGANTALVAYGESVLQTEGPYEGQAVYQAYAELPEFDGSYPVIGSWMVNGYAAGMGIREGDTRITTNKSRFVPHCFMPSERGDDVASGGPLRITPSSDLNR